MKRIVILTQYFLPEMGAPQSRLYETAVGLQQLGWDVKIITAMPNYPTGKVFEDYRGKVFKKDIVEGVDVLRFPIYASNARKSFPRILSMLSFSVTSLFAYFKIIRFKPDYIFTESPPLTLGLTGLLLAKLCGARHILNVSDLWPLSAYRLGAISDGFTYRRLEGLERFLYKYSFACLGQSQQIVDHLESNGSKKQHLYRNGVDVDRFKRNGQISREDNQKLRIVYAGLLGVAQGILSLCKNIDFSSLNAELHIYGDGVERAAIEEYISGNDIRGVIYHGYVKRAELPQTIASYDITLVPLALPIYGAVPSKIYEAMAAGLPLIFTGGGEGAEIINEYQVGWVCEPSDYGQITETVRMVSMMEKSELSYVKENCINAAKNTFNRKIQVKSLNDFLLTHI